MAADDRRFAERFTSDRRLIAAFAILLAANLLVGNATTSVWDQDEAAYAGFAADMFTHQHWVVPEFPYSQAHRKVPLTFWMIAGSYALLGVNEFALRLPSALATATTVVGVWLGGRFLVGRATAKLAALILGSCLFVVNLGKLALTDSVLVACETIAALALLYGAARPSWKATVTLWTAVALGLLAKGPPILILVGGMFVFLLVFHPRRQNLIHLHPWLGLPLAALPLAVWVGLAWQTNPHYVLFLAYWYILRRAGGAVFGQGGPPGTYFLLLFGCLIPWTGYLLGALRDAVGKLRRRRLPYVLLGSWLCGGWLVWEFLPSKLPTYTLGAFPALALLLAHEVRRNLAGVATWAASRALRAGFHVLVAICLGLAASILVVGIGFGTLWCQVLVVVPAAAIVALAFSARHFQRTAAPRAALTTLVLGSLAANLLIWLIVIPGIEPGRSASRRVADAIGARCTPDTTVVVAKSVSAPSLPFYVQRTALRFQDLGAPPAERAPLHVDWSLLRRWKLRELVRQVQAQNPAALSAEEERQARRQRVIELFHSGEPFAFVLDEDQYAAVQEQLPRARVIRIQGWLTDRLARTTYVIALTPSSAAHSTP